MIILASSSPRRRDLMQMVGMKFLVTPTNIDEKTALTNPEEITVEVASRKVKCARCSEEDIVISADTVVVLDGKVLNKPRDSEHAKHMLTMLSDRTHMVYTGVCIKQGDYMDTFCVKTEVTFYELGEGLINMYVSSGEPMDKAGSYGIQGKGALFVKNIVGDYYNVMGLPIAMVSRKIHKLLHPINGDCKKTQGQFQV